MSDFPIVVCEVREPVTLYRGCHGVDADALRTALRSNYEAGRRPHPAERRAIVMQMAVSMFQDDEWLQTFVARRPDRLGTHVARLQLMPGLGICRADTGSAGHWSVWGLPHQLADCVVDVIPVDPGAR
jgi:hypothetical protein